MNNKHKSICAVALVALMGISCIKKEVGPSFAVKNEDGSSYVIAITAEGSSAEATDYILQTNDLMTGVLSPVGRGIEQKSYRMYEKVGKTLLSITYQGVNIVPGYRLDDSSKLQKVPGEFQMERAHARTPVNDSTFVSLFIPRDGVTKEASYYEVNTNQMKINRQARINLFDLGSDSLEWAYPSCLLADNGRLWVPYFQISNSAFDSKYRDSAYIAIYSYPGLVLEKIIKDPRTGTIGIYAGNDGIFKVENGDLYTYSTTALASGVLPSTKPSALLRIKSGTTEFDKDYIFNMEEVTGGYKVAQVKYLGNNKALAQIYSFKEHVAADKWTTRDVRLAVIDLVQKSVTYVNNVPLHTGGLHNKMIQEGNDVYVQINNTEGIYIYKIDIANATGTKGAQVKGKTVMGLFKLYK